MVTPASAIATEVAVDAPSSNTPAPVVSIPFPAPSRTVRGPKLIVFISEAPRATEVAVALPSSNAFPAIVSIPPLTVTSPPNCDALSDATVKVLSKVAASSTLKVPLIVVAEPEAPMLTGPAPNVTVPVVVANTFASAGVLLATISPPPI